MTTPTNDRKLVGWGGASAAINTDGYHAEDYWQDGEYLGPDIHGVYPIYETTGEWV